MRFSLSSTDERKEEKKTRMRKRNWDIISAHTQIVHHPIAFLFDLHYGDVYSAPALTQAHSSSLITVFFQLHLTAWSRKKGRKCIWLARECERDSIRFLHEEFNAFLKTLTFFRMLLRSDVGNEPFNATGVRGLCSWFDGV